MRPQGTQPKRAHVESRFGIPARALSGATARGVVGSKHALRKERTAGRPLPPENRLASADRPCRHHGRAPQVAWPRRLRSEPAAAAQEAARSATSRQWSSSVGGAPCAAPPSVPRCVRRISTHSPREMRAASSSATSPRSCSRRGCDRARQRIDSVRSHKLPKQPAGIRVVVCNAARWSPTRFASSPGAISTEIQRPRASPRRRQHGCAPGSAMRSPATEATRCHRRDRPCESSSQISRLRRNCSHRRYRVDSRRQSVARWMEPSSPRSEMPPASSGSTTRSPAAGREARGAGSPSGSSPRTAALDPRAHSRPRSTVKRDRALRARGRRGPSWLRRVRRAQP